MNRKKLWFLAISVVLMSTVVAAGLFGQAAPSDQLYRYLSIFTEVMSLVQNHYVDEVEPQRLVEGAFSGVTEAIDEFSYYVEPEQMAEHAKYLADERSELGLTVSKRLGFAYIVAVVPGSPAAEAGLESGSFIERVNGELTSDMPIWRIRQELRGSDDQPVRLVVVGAGMEERQSYDIVAAPLERQPLALEELDRVAVIRVPSFQEGTAEEFGTLLQQLEEKKVRKIVVDLRQNATGTIEESIAAADVLLSAGTITTIQGRRIQDRSWEADRDSLYTGDVIVLTDSSTASGAEIFAAAVQGNERAKIVGLPTYGRAIEQRFVELPTGGGLNVTVGQYIDPRGKVIRENGVRPDVTLSAATLAFQRENGEDSQDLILERALQMLRSSPEAVN